MKLIDALHDLYAPIKGIGDRTIRLYELTIDAYGRDLGRSPTTADLTQLEVAKFLARRLRERAPGTAAKDRAQLRALWAFCWDHQVEGTKSGPTVRRIVVPERTPECWLTDEMRRLVAAGAAEAGTVSGVPAGKFWRAAMMTAYDTGERVTPILELKWDDVHDGFVIFRAENRKGRRRDIDRAISPETAQAIAEIAEPRRPKVFPWDKTISTLYNAMDRILRRAGLPANRWSKFHRIRKTTASYYEAAGGSAQRLLDHTSPVVTRRYLDPRVVRPEHDAPTVIPKVS
jgi:integrase